MRPAVLTRAARRNRWAVRATAFLLGVGGLTVFARIEHTRPRVLPTALFVAAVVAIAGLLTDTGGADPAAWSPVHEPGAATVGQDAGLAANARLIENHLSAREVDPLLSARLARMTEDRLARLGLSPTDPAVRQRLGPTLTAVLSGPPRPLREAQIEECIRRIEELTA